MNIPTGRIWILVKRYFTSVVMIGGVVACLFGLYKLLHTRAIDITFDPLFVTAAAIFAAASIFLSAQSWRRFLQATSGHLIGQREALGQNGMVLIGKYVPGKVAGIAARIAANAPNCPVATVIGATLIETIASVFAAALVGGMLYTFAADIRICVAIGVVGLITGWYGDKLCAVALAAYQRVFRRWLTVSAPARIIDPRALRLGLLQLIGQWICISAMVVATTAMVATGLSVGDLGRIAGSYGIAVIVGTAALLFPGGIGPREGAFIWMVQTIIGLESAVALALALRVATTLIDMGGAFGYMYSRLPSLRARH